MIIFSPEHQLQISISITTYYLEGNIDMNFRIHTGNQEGFTTPEEFIEKLRIFIHLFSREIKFETILKVEFLRL